MAKLTIDLDSTTHEKLKELARKDERSLTQYIHRTLRQVAGTLVVNTTTPTIGITSNDISNNISNNIPNKHNLTRKAEVNLNGWS